MTHGAPETGKLDEMRRRLSLLVSTVEDALYKLYDGGLSPAQVEKLTSEVEAVQSEIRTLRTRISLRACTAV